MATTLRVKKYQEFLIKKFFYNFVLHCLDNVFNGISLHV